MNTAWKTYKSELKIAMKKITILQEELQTDIKTIEIDETACRTIINCQIKTQDQVIILLSRINIASFGSLRLDIILV